MKTAITKSSYFGDFVERINQTYIVYEAHFSVCTEVEELPSLPEFPSPARTSNVLAQMEELKRLMHPSSYGCTDSPLASRENSSQDF